MARIPDLLRRAAAAAAAVTLAACMTAKAPLARVDAPALAKALRSTLSKEPRLANSTSVAVDARTGVVRLSGRVASAEERADAGRLVCSVKGVTVVYNEIDVAHAAR